MKFLVFLICLLLNPLVHGDIFESEQPVQSRIPMSLSHQATGTYGLVNQGKHNSLAKNYGGSESNAFFKSMMSKDTLNNQIGGRQLGSISEKQTFNQIGSKEVSQSVKSNFIKFDSTVKKIQGKVQLVEGAIDHSLEKHLLRARPTENFPDIRTTKQFKQHVEDVLQKSTTLTKELDRSRIAYFDSETSTLVIHNLKNPNKSTVFQPQDGIDYFWRLK